MKNKREHKIKILAGESKNKLAYSRYQDNDQESFNIVFDSLVKKGNFELLFDWLKRRR